MYFTFDPGLTVTVNFIFTLREPNVYKPHGFFFGFLATFICFCVTVLFYRYLYFVVNQIKLQSYKAVSPEIWSIRALHKAWHIAYLEERRLRLSAALRSENNTVSNLVALTKFPYFS